MDLVRNRMIMAAVLLVACLFLMVTPAFAEEVDDQQIKETPSSSTLEESSSDESVYSVQDSVAGAFNYIGNRLTMRTTISYWELFRDVQEEYKATDGDLWYYNEGHLTYVVSNKLMLGYDERGRVGGDWGPYDYVTRAQMAAIIYRAENPDSKATSNSEFYEQNSVFTDVPGNRYYTAAINWCQNKGIITGYEDKKGSGVYSTFAPGKEITREEIAAMMERYAKYRKIDTSQASDRGLALLKGTESVSSWAKESIIWCNSEGLITGIKNSDGTHSLAPQKPMWRASVAKVMHVFGTRVLD